MHFIDRVMRVMTHLSIGATPGTVARQVKPATPPMTVGEATAAHELAGLPERHGIVPFWHFDARGDLFMRDH